MGRQQGHVGVLCRLLLGGVWLVAGALKLPDPAENVRAVRAYQLLPETVVPVVGHALPIVEMLVGGCLLLGLITRVAAVMSAVLLTAFVVGIASVWARGSRSSAVASAGERGRPRTRARPTRGRSRAT
jgi:uncharacterized membrane protein YphA (DoxX/SURF4 family)